MSEPDLIGAAWRKSSLSSDKDNCVEVAPLPVGAAWRKSSLSSDKDQCVEVAPVVDAVAVRDSKDPERGALVFSRSEWKHFASAVPRCDTGA